MPPPGMVQLEKRYGMRGCSTGGWRVAVEGTAAQPEVGTLLRAGAQPGAAPPCKQRQQPPAAAATHIIVQAKGI